MKNKKRQTLLGYRLVFCLFVCLLGQFHRFDQFVQPFCSFVRSFVRLLAYLAGFLRPFCLRFCRLFVCLFVCFDGLFVCLLACSVGLLEQFGKIWRVVCYNCHYIFNIMKAMFAELEGEIEG